MKLFLTMETAFPQIISPQTTLPLDVTGMYHGVNLGISGLDKVNGFLPG